MTQPYNPNQVARQFDDPAADADQSFGFQATVSFSATDRKPKQALDASNRFRVSLWRVSAMPTAEGVEWSLELIYGTASSMRRANLQAPLIAYVPGNVQLYAVPVTPDVAAKLHVSLKPVNGYNLQHVRTLIGGVALVDLPPSAVRFTALSASVVNMGGVAVNVASGSSIPLVAPATLNAGGRGILEHEL